MFTRHPFSLYGFSEIAAGDLFASAQRTAYFANRGYTSRGTDSPAWQHYAQRVAQPLAFEQTMIGGSVFGGLARSAGQIVLENNDGGLDTLDQAYAIDGRPVRVLLGEPGAARSAFGCVFVGVARDLRLTSSQAVIEVTDRAGLLEQPLQAQTYDGSGGAEGTENLRDLPHPLAFGRVYNVPAVPVDPVNLIYQVHDGEISGITAVYDRGVALDQVASAPGLGEYAVDLAAGTFELGGLPDGQITADVLGDAADGYADTVGGVARLILARAGLTDADLDLASFARLDVAQPAPVGLWIFGQATAAQALDELLLGAGCWGAFTRDGRFRVGQVAPPTGAPSATFTPREILEIEREPLPPPVSPIAWRTAAAWGRNYTPQTDLAGSVDSARRDFVALERRVAAAADGGNASRHLLAQDVPAGPAVFALRADAEAEAARLLAFYGQPRKLLRLTVPVAFWRLELGSVVLVDYPRFGLAGGVYARIVGVAIDAAANVATLQVIV